jgi:hypothetical protein
MPFSRIFRTRSWISWTLIGSTPAKGSSSRRIVGRVASARESSSAPPLAARERVGHVPGEVRELELLEQPQRLDAPFVRESGIASSTAIRLSNTVIRRNTLGSCGR